MNERLKRMIIVSFIIFALSISALVNSGFSLTQINVTIDSSNVIGSNRFSPGFVLDGLDILHWRDTSVLRQLAIDANFKLVRFYEQKMGKPCTHWDESTKTGKWNWANIDSLVKRLFEIGAEPLIVLGFYSWTYNSLTSAPSGMTTNPTTGLPYPDQWGAYCAEWVEHFKQAGLPVRYYEIIGEPYHYFGWPATQPKLGYFMQLFSSATKAMRSANPNVKIGNDASIMKSFLDYLLSQGENLDFLSYHTYGTGSLTATDSEILQAAETKYIGDTFYGLYGVDKTLQVYKAARGIDLPVIDSENNVDFYYKTGTDPRTQQMLGAVYNALVFRTSMLKNFAYNLCFTFGSSPSDYVGDPSGGVGFGMVNLDNNQPWYPYYAQKMIGSNLALGDQIVSASSSSDDLRVIAWIDKGKLDVLLICQANSARTVYLMGVNGQLNYSKIDNTISWKTPKVQSGMIDSLSPITMNGYTVMLLQGAVSPPSKSFSFQDGFESGSFSAWTGTRLSSGETASVSTTMYHDGARSAKLVSNGGGGSEYSYCYETAPSSTELDARGYFYVQSSGIVENDDRFYFIVFSADSTNVAYAGWRKTNGVTKWTLLIKAAMGNVIAYSASTPSLNRWYSVELHWKKDSTHGEGELYVDGVAVCSITNMDTTIYGDVNQVRLGLPAIYYCGSTTAFCDSAKILKTYIGS